MSIMQQDDGIRTWPMIVDEPEIIVSIGTIKISPESCNTVCLGIPTEAVLLIGQNFPFIWNN